MNIWIEKKILSEKSFVLTVILKRYFPGSWRFSPNRCVWQVVPVCMPSPISKKLLRVIFPGLKNEFANIILERGFGYPEYGNSMTIFVKPTPLGSGPVDMLCSAVLLIV